MAKVLGLGGVFYKADDPQAMRAWYADVLGFELTAWGGASFSPPASSSQQWSLFPADTAYFAPSAHPFMVNLIVDDMAGILERARDAGAEILSQQDEPYGKFAWLMDPAGVKVELWQPL
ncbi:MAG: VOC family protein [Sphingomonadales bacterium]|nr:VOC family protein [Sphingomonadales bacterium]MDE2172124.1 VOC family protein [Sphingomonadales bacterium]